MSRARISQTGGLPTCNGNQAAVLQYPRLLCSVTGSRLERQSTRNPSDSLSDGCSQFLYRRFPCRRCEAVHNRIVVTPVTGRCPANQLGRHLREPIKSALRPAVFNRPFWPRHSQILAGPDGVPSPWAGIHRACGVEKPDHRHRGLLRARRERPRGCCAADERDEFAPFYLIKSIRTPLVRAELQDIDWRRIVSGYRSGPSMAL
jgi:hypothetical protein